MNYTFDFSFLSTYWQDLLDGTWLTIRMTFVSVAIGLMAGSCFAVVRVYGSPWAQRLVRWYVELVRNTPLVIQAFWIFFGLAAMQIRVPALAAALFALIFNVAAYTAEIVRAGIESLPKGQLEAAECLALPRWKAVCHVILPQAIERMYPALVSQFILMMLASSILSQISAEELTAVSYRIQSETFRGFEIYIVIAVVYLLLSWLLRAAMELAGDFAFRRRKALRRSH